MRFKRLEEIHSYISANGSATVEELSEQFAVSKETIRRDLQQLFDENKVIRTKGGAISKESVGLPDVRYFERSGIHLFEKQKIAAKAEAYMQSCQTIGFDSSTTCIEAIKKLNTKERITVITNSAIALWSLSEKDFNIVSTGGFLNKDSLALLGEQANNAIDKYNIDVALISCSGLTHGVGLSDSYEGDANYKKSLIKNANKVILLMDNSKFDKMAFIKITELKNINMIITDRYPGEEWEKEIEEAGVQLIY